MRTQLDLPVNVLDLIKSIHRRRLTGAWVKLVFIMAGMGGAFLLSALFLMLYDLWLGLIPLALLAVALIIGLVKLGTFSLPDIGETCRFIDGKFKLKERSLTFYENYLKQKDLGQQAIIEKQLEEGLRAVDPKEAVPLNYTKRETFFGVVVLLLWLSNVLLYSEVKRALFPFALVEANQVKEMLNQNPKLPEPVKVALSNLSDSLENNTLTDKEVSEALEEAQLEIEQALKMLEDDSGSNDLEVDGSGVERRRDEVERKPSPSPTPLAEPKKNKQKEDQSEQSNEVDQQNTTSGGSGGDNKPQNKDSKKGDDGASKEEKSGEKKEGDSKNGDGEGEGKGSGDQSGKGKGDSKGGGKGEAADGATESPSQGESGEGKGSAKTEDSKNQTGQSGESKGEKDKGEGTGDTGAKDKNSSGDSTGNKNKEGTDDKGSEKSGEGSQDRESALTAAQEIISQIKEKQNKEKDSSGQGKGQDQENKDRSSESESGGDKSDESKNLDQKDQKERGENKNKDNQTDDLNQNSQQKTDGDSGQKEKEAKPESGREGETPGENSKEPESKHKDKASSPLGESSQGKDTKSGEMPPLPVASDTAKRFGEFEGGTEGQSGGQKAFQDVKIGESEEKLDPSFATSDAKLSQNKKRATYKTTLEEVELAQPEPVKSGEKQEIPLEYKDLIK